MVFDTVHVLTFAYGVMGFVALCGYMPQMLAFWRNPMLCQETPMTTWVLWSCQTVVFHLYAVLVNGDVMFIGTTAAFMVATLVCLGLQLYGRRYARTRGLKGRRAEVVPFPTPPQSPGAPERPKDVA